MKTRIALGLVMTLALAALMAAPVSGEPGKGQGKGTQVSKGDQDVPDNVCVSAVEAIEGLDAVDGVEKYKWRFAHKRNGRPSKLHCRIRGATVDDGVVDPPAPLWGNVLRLRGEEAAKLCPQPPIAGYEVGEILRARFMMNARGNGLLKCVYAPPSA